MEKKEFKEIIEKELSYIGEKIKQDEIEKLYQYTYIIKEWNEKINLTAIVDEKEMIVKHFVDSLTIRNMINDQDYLLDIGTGAGFPGIPIKIVKDNTKMVLMDSLNKRVQFLNQEVIRKLDLKSIVAIHARAEEMARQKLYREQFDIVTSRAVAPLNVLVEYMLPFTKIGGKCICMKGPKVEEEIQQANKAITQLGGKIEEIKTLEIGEEKNIRNIVVLRKEKSTPKSFPRKAGTPSKFPII